MDHARKEVLTSIVQLLDQVIYYVTMYVSWGGGRGENKSECITRSIDQCVCLSVCLSVFFRRCHPFSTLILPSSTHHIQHIVCMNSIINQ